MKRGGTWVVVADGARASVYDRQAKGADLELIHEMASEDARRKTSEIVSDREGRYADAGPDQRSGMEPPTDPQRYAKESFARDLADWLHKAAVENRFDRLVLVAAPRTLGDLRGMLSKPVQEKVTAEIDKDLTTLPPREVSGHLARLL